MNFTNELFTDTSGRKYKRVNKTAAKNLANSGHKIGVCAHKMNPFHPYWSMCAWYDPNEAHDAYKDMTPFEWFVLTYEIYNCNYETGYYSAFYVEV